jgi:hypothetical protein
VLFYKPTPRNCDACHGASIPKAKSATARIQDEEMFMSKVHYYGLLQWTQKQPLLYCEFHWQSG